MNIGCAYRIKNIWFTHLLWILTSPIPSWEEGGLISQAYYPPSSQEGMGEVKIHNRRGWGRSPFHSGLHFVAQFVIRQLEQALLRSACTMIDMCLLGVASLKIQKNLVQNLYIWIKIFLKNLERFSLGFCMILSEATKFMWDLRFMLRLGN